MLQGKNAIITGARTGIGLAILEKFASQGANVWAIVHREDNEFLSKVQTLMEQYHVWIKVVYIDLNDEINITSGIKQIIQEKQPIDILVNAAGTISPNRLIQMTAMADMRRVMQVNFFAAVQICQLVSRVMCRQQSGNIVNIASIAGLDGDFAQLEYAASKAALICATKKMAFEWGKYGIRVNAIAPGLIETKMLEGMNEKVVSEMISRNAIHRKGLPSEIADLCVYLSSEQSSYISAQTIRIDGGGTNFLSNIN
jgi:3-oxoacyl-[acyl-carrier protein] reductase